MDTFRAYLIAHSPKPRPIFFERLVHKEIKSIQDKILRETNTPQLIIELNENIINEFARIHSDEITDKLKISLGSLAAN